MLEKDPPASLLYSSVIPSSYEIKLKDVTAKTGDTVRILCPVPNALREEVSTTSWVRRPDFNIFPSTIGGEIKDIR
jgi:hypothetical protein